MSHASGTNTAAAAGQVTAATATEDLQLLIDELVKRGVKLQLRDGDVLRFSAPKGALNAELKQRLKSNKEALKDFLRRTSADDTVAAEAAEPASVVPAARKFPVANRSGSLPLSHTQLRLWFLDQLAETAHNAYNMFDLKELNGELSVPALRQAFDYLTARHESLRTSFHSKDGRPYQKVNILRDSVLGEPTDLSALDASAQKLALDKIIETERRYSFDLEQAPLLRVLLVKLAEQRHMLIYSKHHIISDGWSVEIFQREVIAAYAAFAAGGQPELPALPVQYGDFAVWQHSAARRAELETQLSWWKAQLRAVPQSMDWPLDFARPAVQEHAGRQLLIEFKTEDAARWRKLARDSGVTSFMLGVTLYAALLARLTGQTDLVIGSPVANRNHSEFEAIIGFFANTLALRVRLNDDPDFRTLLGRVRAVILAANQRQDTAFERIVEVLEPERRTDQDPIIQTVYMNHIMPADRVSLSGVSFESYVPDQQNAKFDCSLTTIEDGETLVNMWEYRSSLFTPASIQEWNGRILQILHAWSSRPELCLSELPILLPDEQSRLEQLATGKLQNKMRSGIMARFDEVVAQQPDALALHTATKDLTYAELQAAARRWAAWLNARGIGADARVAIVLERSAQDIALILGILAAGAAYVPLDANYPAARLKQMCAIADVQLLLAPSSATSLGKEFAVVDIEAARVEAMQLPAREPRFYAGPEHAAYVMFTSGSTGTPKGVVIPQRAIERLCVEPDWIKIDSSDRIGALAPLGFDASTFEVFMALLNGAELVLQTRPRAGVNELAEFIADNRLSVLWLTSGLFSLMIDVAAEKLTALRYLLAGGDVLSPEHVKQALHSLPNTKLLNGYGPTENTTFTAVYEVPRDYDGVAAVPLGSPISGTSIRVLDANMQPQPPMLAGELYAGGEGLARAYARDPRRTALSFVPDPFATQAGGRLYRTGDRVRMRRDGTLEFLGRIDRQVKIAGHRIDPREVEATLSRHANVGRAAVVIRGTAAENRRMAVFVERTDTGLAPGELTEFAGKHLPNYVIPAEVVFVDVLPLTVNGKIDRRALLEINSEASPDLVEQPADEREAQVCSIFAGVLQLETFGPQANFFNLGGHSLLATQLASRLRTEFEVDVPISQVFNTPTPRGMLRSMQNQLDSRQASSTLDKVTSRAAQDLPQLPAVCAQHSTAPLSAAQSRLWFLAHMPGASAAYNMPAALKLQGGLDRTQLRTSLDLLVQQHDVLRTRIVLESGAQEPRQIIDPAAQAHFEEVDLRGLTAAEQAREVKQIVHTQFGYAFKLAEEHPLRCMLIVLQHAAQDAGTIDPSGEYLLIVNVHHIAGDAWSFNIFVNDLVRFYGGEHALNREQLQYADIAVWQRAWRAAGGLDQQREYWTSALQGAPTLLHLPTDHDYPAVQTFSGGHVDLTISPDLQARWEQLGKDLGATTFMTYLAAWGLLLGRHAHSEDVLIAAPIANRNRPEFESVMGFFVNTLVLRVKQESGATVREFMQSVMQSCLQAYSNQDLPFDELLELLDVERPAGRSPLVQVMFDVQNAPMAPLALSELNISMLEAEFDVAKFELSLSMAEDARGMRAIIEYNSDLFEHSSVENMGRRFVALLEQLSQNLDRPLATIHALSAAESAVLASDGPVADQPADLFTAVFEQTAAMHGSRPALDSADACLTYTELDDYSRKLAAHLQARGVGPGDFVGIALARTVVLPAALLAVLRCGAAFVPLDIAYPAERLKMMLADTAPQLVLLDASSADAEVFAGRPSIRIDQLPEKTSADVNSDAPQFTHVEISPEQAAYVIYTSGSTGRPKGVVITQAAMAEYLQAFQMLSQLDSSDRYAQFTSINFDAAIEELFAPLCAGAVIVLPQTADMGDFGAYEAFLAQQSISVASMTTAFWQEWMAAGDTKITLPNLRRVVMGGEAGQRPGVTQFAARLPHCELFNCYGPTETTISATIDVVDCAAQPTRGTVPIGLPVGRTQIYLLDAAGRPVPPGSIGDLWISGPQLARGYHKRPATTAWAFVPDPYSSIPGARMYRSGDHARILANGNLQFVGRSDDQVKIRGFRIELGEIERCLFNHPAVERAAVKLWRQPAGPQLHAYAELKADREPDAQTRRELREFMRAQMPAHMQPHKLHLTDALARLPNGKVNYKALRHADEQSVASGAERTAPANDLERRIVSIWQATIDFAEPDVHANFFDQGGNSLKSIALLTRLQSAFPGVFDVADMFDKNTVRLQAEAVNATQDSNHSASAVNQENTNQPSKQRIGKISL